MKAASFTETLVPTYQSSRYKPDLTLPWRWRQHASSKQL